MNLFAEFPPALILMIGALLVPFLKGKARSLYVIILPILALISVLMLRESIAGSRFSFAPFSFTEEKVELLRVDRLARIFGIIFTVNAVAAFIYAFYVRKSTQHIAALFYIGGALGCVFAGDLLSLYVFWESMAVSSTFIILARNTERAKGAAFRYIMVHILGGLLLLAGIVITIAAQDGSIAFNAFDFELQNNAGTWLILLGILVNAGAPPLSAWLPDSYPSASVTGGLILSAYTTKTAVYTLIRGFPGWEPLIWIGCAMVLYGVLYAIIESDMRRILAYAIINQVGFMVCAVGIGTEEALSGATAAAFCHILYKSLLWMATGAILYRTGKSALADLGGLRQSMPMTTVLCCIGALSMAAPGTCGFTSKTIIILAAEHEKLFWPWIILEIGSVGIFLAAGIRLVYFVFFGKDSGLRPKEAPLTMLAGMGLLAFLCFFFGMFPQPLYDRLPWTLDYQPYKWAKLVTMSQLLVFAGVAFYFLRPFLEDKRGTTLDFDWFYRKGGPLFYTAADKSLNSFNTAAGGFLIGGVARRVSHFFESGASRFAAWILTPVWAMQGHSSEEIDKKQQSIFKRSRRGAFPIGITAFCAVVLLGMLAVIFLSK